MIDASLALPSDVPAERVVIGCAVDSPQAARHAVGLDAADFVVGIHRRLYTAALACPLLFRWDGSRTKAIASAAEVPFEVVEELRSSIPALDDRNRWWFCRVREATLRRRVMAEVVDVHNDLGSGGGLDEATAGLERALAVASGNLVGALAGPEVLVVQRA